MMEIGGLEDTIKPKILCMRVMAKLCRLTLWILLVSGILAISPFKQNRNKINSKSLTPKISQ